MFRGLCVLPLPDAHSWRSVQGCRLAHLDRPYAEWPRAVCSTPAAAMKLPSHGVIHPGGPANLVVFRARCFSELLARPQHDRVRPARELQRDLRDVYGAL